MAFNDDYNLVPLSSEVLRQLASVKYYSLKDMSPEAVRNREECQKAIDRKMQPYVDALRRMDTPTADGLVQRVGGHCSFGIGFNNSC